MLKYSRLTHFASQLPAFRSRRLVAASCLIGLIAAWGMCNAYVQERMRTQRLQAELLQQQRATEAAGNLAKQLKELENELLHYKGPHSHTGFQLRSLTGNGEAWHWRNDGAVTPLSQESGLPDHATQLISRQAFRSALASGHLIFLAPTASPQHDSPLYFAWSSCAQGQCQDRIVGLLSPGQSESNLTMSGRETLEVRTVSGQVLSRKSFPPPRSESVPPGWISLLLPGLRDAQPVLQTQAALPGYPLQLEMHRVLGWAELLPAELYWLPLIGLAITFCFFAWTYRLYVRMGDVVHRFRDLEQSQQLLSASNKTLRERLRKLTASQRDLQTLLDTVQVGVLILDGVHWRIQASNQRAGELFGQHARNLNGQSADTLFDQEIEHLLCRQRIGQNLAINDCELRLKRINGETFWALLSMRGLFFNGQPAVGMSVIDISERIAHAEQLREEKRETERVLQQLQSVQQELLLLATQDDLTGVANRRHFTHSAESLLQEAMTTQRPLSLVMLDIDYFKQVNDTHGHDAGDAILAQTLTLCQSLIRQGDLLGRLGGEEFALLLPDTDEVSAFEIAERIRIQIATQPFRVGDSILYITVSLGTSSWLPNEETTSLASLLKAADLALYQAKSEGRNRTFTSRALSTTLPYPNSRRFSAHEC
jgi:diguanylate cyclase (GGDEF)-like protein/PAS domain S-box-containing protein